MLSQHGRTLVDYLPFPGPELYDHLKAYILSEEQLRENGFPEFVPGNAGIVTMKPSDRAVKNSSTNRELCAEDQLLPS